MVQQSPSRTLSLFCSSYLSSTEALFFAPVRFLLREFFWFPRDPCFAYFY